jgi:hypothetical protein
MQFDKADARLSEPVTHRTIARALDENCHREERSDVAIPRFFSQEQ